MSKGKTIVTELRQAIRAAECRGVTRYRIAKISGLSQGMLSRFMAGENQPRLDTAGRLALAVGKRLVLVDS